MIVKDCLLYSCRRQNAPLSLVLGAFYRLAKCSGKKSDRSKMATRVPHSPTLRETWVLLSEILTTSDLLRVFSIPRPYLFRRFQLRIWTSNNRSFLIFANNYVAPSSPTLITCNTSINANSYGKWQIFLHATPPTSAGDHGRYKNQHVQIV